MCVTSEDGGGSLGWMGGGKLEVAEEGGKEV